MAHPHPARSREIEGGGVTSPRGFVAAATASGIKKKKLLDMALVHSFGDCAAAAVFTKHQFVAAPVVVDRQTLAANSDEIRLVVANSGNANACTGQEGLANARRTQQFAAMALDCRPDQVLVLSTGVIGVQLPMDKIAAGIQTLAGTLTANGGQAAAQAIMTTDTHAKEMAVELALSGGKVTIGGMTKGSGMVHPDMATVLGLLTTDAALSAEQLDDLLRRAMDKSFNRISVDGDTSTNDTVLALANGHSGVAIGSEADQKLLSEAFDRLCIDLAKMLVLDGEGASKFVEIQIDGAPDDESAHRIANTIAISPLVKTAIAGGDANWGRFVMAAGRAGVEFDQSRVDLWIGQGESASLQLVRQGTPTDYLEEDAAAIFASQAIKVYLDLHAGRGTVVVWTCDLTHDYVSINADYRT